MLLGPEHFPFGAMGVTVQLGQTGWKELGLGANPYQQISQRRPIMVRSLPTGNPRS